MSGHSDDEYVSADEKTNDELLNSDHSNGVTESSDLQGVHESTNTDTTSQDQQPEVVKVVDNKYVSDAESVKSGGVVELTEEQRKVCASLPRLYIC